MIAEHLSAVNQVRGREPDGASRHSPKAASVDIAKTLSRSELPDT